MIYRPKYYEFFCGGGLVRAGLGKHWDCLFANDISEKKTDSYRRNWGDRGLVVADVKQIKDDMFASRKIEGQVVKRAFVWRVLLD